MPTCMMHMHDISSPPWFEAYAIVPQNRAFGTLLSLFALALIAHEVLPFELTGGRAWLQASEPDAIQVKQNLKQAATIVQSLKQETTPASVGVGAPLESLISRLEKLEKGLEKGINLGVFDRLVADAEEDMNNGKE